MQFLMLYIEWLCSVVDPTIQDYYNLKVATVVTIERLQTILYNHFHQF